jgi:hypothetical protein
MRSRQVHPSTRGPVGLRDHQLDLMTRVEKGSEGRYGELGRAGENDLQENA